MSITSVKVEIPGAAIAAQMRGLRCARDEERAAALDRLVETQGERGSDRSSAELLARRELIVAERGSAGRLDEAIAGGRLDEADRLAQIAEREIEAEWTSEAMQECALAVVNDHPWSSVRTGSRELSVDGKLRATIDFDDGRAMPASADAKLPTADDDVGSVQVELRVAGAGISRVETAAGTLVGCDGETYYVDQWTQDLGVGAEVVDPEDSPRPAAASGLRSRRVGGSR